MQVSKIQNAPAFKGYDARPLQGIMMSTNVGGIGMQMREIAEKEGVKLFAATNQKVTSGIPDNAALERWTNEQSDTWAQDYWGFTKKDILCCYRNIHSFVGKHFNLPTNPVQDKFIEEGDKFGKHIMGGNYFLIGDNEILVGEDELEKIDPQTIQKMFDVEKVHVVPQMDFHIDMFLRPLDNKRILLADNNATRQLLSEAMDLQGDDVSWIVHERQGNDDIGVLLKQGVDDFIYSGENDFLPKKIEAILDKGGFEVVKVPGRITGGVSGLNRYNCKPRALVNFINAQAFKNDNDEIVYIYAKNKLDKILKEKTGIDFPKVFEDSIKNYVDKIYSVELPNKLLFTNGSIHCLGAEVPKLDILS
jgi:hypothetical protein